VTSDITSAPSLSLFKQPTRAFLFPRLYPDLLSKLSLTFHLIGLVNNWHYLGSFKQSLYNNDDIDRFWFSWQVHLFCSYWLRQSLQRASSEAKHSIRWENAHPYACVEIRLR